jgi:hypothetical protein
LPALGARPVPFGFQKRVVSLDTAALTVGRCVMVAFSTMCDSMFLGATVVVDGMVAGVVAVRGNRITRIPGKQLPLSHRQSLLPEGELPKPCYRSTSKHGSWQPVDRSESRRMSSSALELSAAATAAFRAASAA